MSKQINIGGRIHSTEVGNVTTGANEVLDDTKGKKQNVINSETDAELLRLDQSKQNNLTFDNTPTENSTNPVTSGGVYAANITLHELIEAILVLIPSAASALNQLADKNFVNSSVSTATATFRGTYNVVTDLELAYDATHEQIATKLGQVIATADNNDYAFVQVPVSATSTDIRRTERYKFNGTVWGYEYDLNTSGFTAVQWEAINSGITALLVSKLTNLPTAEVLATMFAAKQNVLTFDEAPTALSTNPVYSGGVNAAIKAITDLIPAEAATTNQLADKAYVLASILAATPAFKGQFTSLVDLQAVQSPKAGDLGIVRTKDSDGYDVFTFYQYLNNDWNVFYTLSRHPQTKPATTGTTGDYPFNGMGRVELPMNIVEGVNTLTQSMMPTATGGNTVYVIKYDFTLGEDITVPSNCILEFEGGSISASGSYDTITGNPYIINNSNKQIFNSVDIDLKNDEINALWFGAKGDDSTDNTDVFNYLFNKYKKIYIPSGKYLCGSISMSSGAYGVQIYGDNIYENKHANDSTCIKYTGNGYLLTIANDFYCSSIKNIVFVSNNNCSGVLKFNNMSYGCLDEVYFDNITDTVATSSVAITIDGYMIATVFGKIGIKLQHTGIVINCKDNEDWATVTQFGNAFGSIYIHSGINGIIVKKGNLVFFGVTVDSMSNIGIKIDGSENPYSEVSVIMEKCYFEDCTNGAIDSLNGNRAYKGNIIKLHNCEFHTSVYFGTNKDGDITFEECIGLVIDQSFNKSNIHVIGYSATNTASELYSNTYGKNENVSGFQFGNVFDNSHATFQRVLGYENGNFAEYQYHFAENEVRGITVIPATLLNTARISGATGYLYIETFNNNPIINTCLIYDVELIMIDASNIDSISGANACIANYKLDGTTQAMLQRDYVRGQSTIEKYLGDWHVYNGTKGLYISFLSTSVDSLDNLVLYFKIRMIGGFRSGIKPELNLLSSTEFESFGNTHKAKDIAAYNRSTPNNGWKYKKAGANTWYNLDGSVFVDYE